MVSSEPRPVRVRLGPDAARGRLEVLLKEYDALRSEVTTRLGASATLVGFAAAAIGIAASGRGGSRWIAAAVVGVLILLVWVSYLRQLAGIRTYLIDLEHQINLASRDAYGLAEDVVMLSWEHSLSRKETELRKLLGRFMLMRRDDYRHRPESSSSLGRSSKS
jgi:hypothetical protein